MQIKRELTDEIVEVLEQNGLQALPETLEEAELSDRRFLFPSYGVSSLRGMKVSEENAITSRKKNKDGEGVNEILKNCSNGEKVIDWLVGDRVFALLQIKRLSHGDWYDFKVPCPHCNEMVLWSENLAELPIQYLKEPGKTQEFKVHMDRVGTDVTYRLLDGKDERKLEKLRKANDEEMQAALLLFRTQEIEGVKIKNMKWFNELEAMDRITYTEHVDEHDCGVDTTVTIECDNCYRSFESDLPMGIDFFLPRKRSKKA